MALRVCNGTVCGKLCAQEAGTNCCLEEDTGGGGWGGQGRGGDGGESRFYTLYIFISAFKCMNRRPRSSVSKLSSFLCHLPVTQSQQAPQKSPPPQEADGKGRPASQRWAAGSAGCALVSKFPFTQPQLPDLFCFSALR